MTTYGDYLWNFPRIGLALALEGLDALRAQLSLDMNTGMLGDPRDGNGRVVADPFDSAVAWVGRPGIGEYSYVDPDTDEVIEVPARGNPDRYYMHIRSSGDPATVVFDPADYGLVPTDPFESAKVLGIWAGDDMLEATA